MTNIYTHIIYPQQTKQKHTRGRLRRALLAALAAAARGGRGPLVLGGGEEDGVVEAACGVVCLYVDYMLVTW